MDEQYEELKIIQEKILNSEKLFYEKHQDIFKKNQLSRPLVKKFVSNTFADWKF